jgi:hypothetical protein
MTPVAVTVNDTETIIHFKDGTDLYLNNADSVFLLGTLMQYYQSGHFTGQGEGEHHRIIGVNAARIADGGDWQ